jgi:hypothetical protein
MAKNKFLELKKRPLDRVSDILLLIPLSLPIKSIEHAFPLLTLL